MKSYLKPAFLGLFKLLKKMRLPINPNDEYGNATFYETKRIIGWLIPSKVVNSINCLVDGYVLPCFVTLANFVCLHSLQVERRFTSRLSDMRDRLDQANTTTRSMQNYVSFLKSSYSTVFDDIDDGR